MEREDAGSWAKMPAMSVASSPAIVNKLADGIGRAANGRRPSPSSGQDETERSYTVIKELGSGFFGTVCVADWHSPLPSGALVPAMQHSSTRPEYIGKRLVAIKRMKRAFSSWDDCLQLNEVRALILLPPHPHIIPLYDLFLPPSTKELHIVFECMEGNLYQLTKSRRGVPLATGLVASIVHQTLLGLAHIHSHGYFHRDMKPENLLITTTGLADYPTTTARSREAPVQRDVLVLVKLADFGLARAVNRAPPFTEYVSTRWYRAPEVLLRAPRYGPPVDLWALGAILAETVNLNPLFAGNDEVDQLMQICRILGPPRREHVHTGNAGGAWSEGLDLAARLRFVFPEIQPVDLRAVFPSTLPHNLLDMIQGMLRYDPARRISASACLQHPFILNDMQALSPTHKLLPASAALGPRPENLSPPYASSSRSITPAPAVLPGPHPARAPVPSIPGSSEDLGRPEMPNIPPSDAGPHASGPSDVKYQPAAEAAPVPNTRQARKEAQRRAKEAEKARREAEQTAMRERARAVMEKRKQYYSAQNGDAWRTGI